MKPENKMEPEETDNEPSLDKMLDLDDPKLRKALGEWVAEMHQERLAQEAKASDKKQ